MSSSCIAGLVQVPIDSDGLKHIINVSPFPLKGKEIVTSYMDQL